MSKAIVQPDEIRRFAQALKSFNTRLEHDLVSIQGAMQVLGQTWRDQEQLKFADEFDDTVRRLRTFLQASEAHIPFLLRKAAKADEYLQQR